jgi:hypothetical protein
MSNTETSKRLYRIDEGIQKIIMQPISIFILKNITLAYFIGKAMATKKEVTIYD